MVDELVRQTQERAEKFQVMAARVQDMSITERSADGSVRLTVSAKGMLTDLTISEDARSRSMAEVSALIMRTLQRAQSRIPELLQEVLVDTVGTEDQAANHLMAEAAKSFPRPPEEEVEQLPENMRFDPEHPDDQEPERPRPPSQRTQAPRPRSRNRGEDDGDGNMPDSIYS